MLALIFEKKKVNKNYIKHIPGQCIRCCLKLFWVGSRIPWSQSRA